MLLICLCTLSILAHTLADGSRCHSVVDGRLINLKPLQQTYRIIEDDTMFLFSLCAPMASDAYGCPRAFSVVVQNGICTKYSSAQLTTGYKVSLLDDIPSGVRVVQTSDEIIPNNTQPLKTSIQILCDESESSLKIEDIYIEELTLYVEAKSMYGCATLDVNRIWKQLSEYSLFSGIVLILVGILELFFGRMLLKPTIFIAAYSLSFISLGLLLFDLTVGPETNQIYIYFCLLILALGCCCIGYICMSMSNITIGLVGAWMGFILALLLNTALNLSHNSLTVLTVVFCLSFGLLTYWYSDQVVIISTAITGSYLIVRPFSWIFGGFPNELIANIHAQPTVLIYLAIIIILTTIGCIYQFLKLKRETQPTAEATAIEQQIETRIDILKSVVDSIIEKYRPQERPMQEIQLPIINHDHFKTPNNGPIVRREDSEQLTSPLKIQGQVIRFSKQ